MEKDLAEKIANNVDQLSVTLNDLAVLSELLSVQDGKTLRQKVGVMMLEANDILQFVFKHFPDLDNSSS